MNSTVLAVIIILPLILITVAAAVTFSKKAQGKSGKKAMKFNLITFAIIAVLMCMFTFIAGAEGETNTAAPAQQTQEATEAAAATSSSNGLGLLAAGLVTGLAGIGGGIAVAAGAPAAIAATSEDPKSFGKSLIFVALGESIALYGVVISILILNKV